MAQNLSCLLYGPFKAKFEDRPIPEIEDPYDVLIRIGFVGVCGSDVHFWKHGGIVRTVSDDTPIIMGHEASGTVHAVGSAVTRVQPGDRVAIEPGFPCRRCDQCKAGRYNLCPRMRFAADPPNNHGTLTRLFRIPEDFAYKIPDSLSLQEAVLVEPLAVAVHGARLADLSPGQSVLIQGSGTIGLMAAATARAFGAGSIYIADINKTKLEFAEKFVECTTFMPDVGATPQDEAARFKTVSGQENGVDVVLECSGVESSLQTGLYAAAPGGVLVQIGMGKLNQTIPLGDMCGREVVLKTSFRYGAGDYDIALSLLETDRVSVKSLISSTVPFENTTEAWDRTMRGEGIKNLIQVAPDQA